MKHGHALPKDRRDGMAREAFAIFGRSASRIRALEAIEDRFDVSQPTARNLLDRGRTLSEQDVALRPDDRTPAGTPAVSPEPNLNSKSPQNLTE